MDKSKWEYKKLGEVGDIITGGTPPTKDARNYSSNDYCFVKPSDLTDERILFLDDSEFHVSSYAYSNSRKLPKGSVLVCCIGSIGKLGILNVDATCNQQINAIIPKSGFDSKYLAYCLLASKGVMLNIANAPVVPIINKSQFSNIEIKTCPIADQQRIVAELDCLNEMIVVKQEQLKEFDKLAQSIFYDMFGDPVANEKKFEKHPFGKIAAFKNGLNFKPVDEGNSVKILGVSDFQDLKEIKSADLLSLKCIKETVDNDYYLKTGDIVIVRSNGSKKLVGRNVLISFEDKNVAYSGFCIRCRLISDDCSPLYLNSVLSTPSMKELMTSGGRGCNIANINQQTLNKLMVPLPPLTLQQQFADKISAIEAQKELVKQSIAETQALLDYTMDKYFG